MVWKDCGYISYSKNHTMILLAVKHEYYVIDTSALKDVLDGKLNYALVRQAPPKEDKDKKLSSKLPPKAEFIYS